MSVWDSYYYRINIKGDTKREAQKRREIALLRMKLRDSLSYHNAIVAGSNRDVAIVNTDNLNIKSIYSLPGETLHLGDLVEWMDSYWLITEKDFNTEIYTKCKMTQCNYLLKWIDDDDIIREQWTIVEDGTKLECTLLYTIVWHIGNGM